jgi:hypothetical protein
VLQNEPAGQGVAEVIDGLGQYDPESDRHNDAQKNKISTKKIT